MDAVLATKYSHHLHNNQKIETIKANPKSQDYFQGRKGTWVRAKTRIIVEYFFNFSSKAEISFFPSSDSYFFGIYCKCFLLRLVPFFVKSPLHLLAQMLGPNSVQWKAICSFHITSNSNHNHGRSFNDSDGFTSLLLVKFRTNWYFICE